MGWPWWHDFIAVYDTSLGLGGILTYYLLRLLDEQIIRKIPYERGDLKVGRTSMAAWIGLVERAVVTTCVIWLPPATIPFIGGWTALKIAGGWGLLKVPTTRHRAIYFAGLIGNVASYTVAILAGLAASPASLPLLSK